MADVPKPECLALVLCEQVIQDGRTKNLTLVNIFNMIAGSFGGKQAPRFPRLAVFVSLTNGHATSQGELIIKEPGGEEVFHGKGPIQFPNPLAVVEMTFDIRGLPLPRPGQYAIEFYCDGELVRQRRFQVAAQADTAGEAL